MIGRLKKLLVAAELDRAMLKEIAEGNMCRRSSTFPNVMRLERSVSIVQFIVVNSLIAMLVRHW